MRSSFRNFVATFLHTRDMSAPHLVKENSRRPVVFRRRKDGRGLEKGSGGVRRPRYLSSFVEPLEYEPTGTFRNGRREYRLLTAFVYEVGAIGSGLSVSVPAGFVTDFASVPYGFRWLVKPEGKYSQACALHDYLYLKGVVSRWMCDRILYEAMQPLHVNVVIRIIIYYAVRLGGWRYYDRKNLSGVQIAHNESSEEHKEVIPQANNTYVLETPESDIGY